MKKLILNLFVFIGLNSFAQFNGLEMFYCTDITISGNAHFELPHAFLSKRDTTGYSQAVENLYYIKFTGLNTVENHEWTISNDSSYYVGHDTAHINIVVSLNATTSNLNDDIWLRVRNVRSGSLFYAMQTSRGAGNYQQWLILGYDHDCQPNDAYLLEVTNKTNGNDLTVYSVTIEFITKHFE